jgi:hypothetical protein
MAGSAVTLAEVSTIGGHKIGTVQDLRIAMSLVTRRANTSDPERVDLRTGLVVDTPDGVSWRVGSVSYQEDLAGVMVLTLADPMVLDDDDGAQDNASRLRRRIAQAQAELAAELARTETTA